MYIFCNFGSISNIAEGFQADVEDNDDDKEDDDEDDDGGKGKTFHKVFKMITRYRRL